MQLVNTIGLLESTGSRALLLTVLPLHQAITWKQVSRTSYQGYATQMEMAPVIPQVLPYPVTTEGIVHKRVKTTLGTGVSGIPTIGISLEPTKMARRLMERSILSLEIGTERCFPLLRFLPRHRSQWRQPANRVRRSPMESPFQTTLTGRTLQYATRHQAPFSRSAPPRFIALQ